MNVYTDALLTPEPWTADALCAQVGGDAWFPEDDTQTARKARTICGKCAARQDCLAYALRNNETHGIWGGTTPRERAAIRRTAVAE